MTISKYCTCCDEIANFHFYNYKNESAKYCDRCVIEYSAKERNKRVESNLLKIITNIKDTNI